MTKAKIWVEQKPWQRIAMDGQPHDHGEQLQQCVVHVRQIVSRKHVGVKRATRTLWCWRTQGTHWRVLRHGRPT